MLVIAVAFSSSRGLQCGAGGGAATGQTGGRRDPLWERHQNVSSISHVYETKIDSNNKKQIKYTKHLFKKFSKSLKLSVHLLSDMH